MSEKAAETRAPLLLHPLPRRHEMTNAERRSRFCVVTTTILAQLAALLLLVSSWWDWSHRVDISLESTAVEWSWSDVRPSRDLEWQSCYDGMFQSFRSRSRYSFLYRSDDFTMIQVPMDWRKPSEDKRVVLGVIKLPAKSKNSTVPPLLINPVGISTPRADCWANTQKRTLWDLQETAIVDERPGLVYDAYSRAAAFSGVCEEAMGGTGILRHLSTASAARDMLEIMAKSGHEKLRYWGFSYGTLLGGVFAAMYPDSVDRLVSDDYLDYFEGDRASFVKDADSILDAFDAACHSVGPERCALWSPEGAAGVTNRRAGVIESLRQSPVLVPAGATDSGPRMPLLITYSFLQALTRMLLYKPLGNAQRLAGIYAGLERGDGVPYYQTVMAMAAESKDSGRNGGDSGGDADDTDLLLCPLTDTPATEPRETGMEPDAFPAIMCSDAAVVEDTPAEFAGYLDKILGLSRWTGAASISFRLVCVGRTQRPDWRFTIEPDSEIVTDTPVLFINNLHDNVTPLDSAHNNSAHFPGSVVLQQNSLGHCSLAAPSSCTARYIQRYFSDGALPDPGTECEQDYALFETPSEDVVLAQDEVSRASWEMSRRGDIWFGRV
ncbi:TAP-like protein [Geosmithia morbida]|uniref:TAP-like protein n=1 Tax=Geosmithia morbida TaxID=1094350 RepID=A0A9P4YR13_9HYPO|nr:TAP-like protein [Geosmithia morbida]KAF4121185.1 TAP-like protein [Geosmithia morbida]